MSVPLQAIKPMEADKIAAKDYFQRSILKCLHRSPFSVVI